MNDRLYLGIKFSMMPEIISLVQKEDYYEQSINCKQTGGRLRQ